LLESQKLQRRRFKIRYKNTKTGAVIDSPCVIKGENWIEEIEKVKKPVKATTKSKAKG
jgi:hypothetical protein